VDATCEPGERLIGGAGSWQMDDRAGLTLVESRPATAAGGDPPNGGTFQAWHAEGENVSFTPGRRLQAWAICLQ
ncbi:MAG: hypothetical protein ACRDMY_15090, partial [Gaiellaceae bacterium]